MWACLRGHQQGRPPAIFERTLFNIGGNGNHEFSDAHPFHTPKSLPQPSSSCDTANDRRPMANNTETCHMTTATSTKAATTLPSHVCHSSLRILPAFFGAAFLISSINLIHRFLPSNNSFSDSSNDPSKYSWHPLQNKLLNHTDTNFETETQASTVQSPSQLPKFSHECVEVQPVDAVYRIDPLSRKPAPPFNTRSYCITSSICISPRTASESGVIYERDSVRTTCRKSTPSLIDAHVNPREIPLNCTVLKKSVYCMHGIKNRAQYPIICPQVLPLTAVPADAAAISSDTVIIVPAFEHMGNIYHFAHVVGSVVHIISSLRPLSQLYSTSMAMDGSGLSILRTVTILFKGNMPEAYGPWQGSILNAVINARLYSLGFHVNVISSYEDHINHPPSSRVPQFAQPRTLCSRSSVFIGPRDTREWPFASYESYKYYSRHSKYKSISTSVPVEAMLFKAAIYHAYNLSTILHTSSLLRSDIRTVPDNLLLDLPPLSIGYARRNSDDKPDPSVSSGELFVNGTTRRFSDADEEWFLHMLQTQCRTWGLSFEVLETPKDIPVIAQLAMFKRTGFVVGIHGANLVNSIVMHSFGALLELSNHESQCYFRGANSGLNYWVFRPSHIATPLESFCSPKDVRCWNNPKHRRIHVENINDRVRITQLVVEGIERILTINKRFKHFGGVPVVLNRTSSEYEIYWSL